MRMWTFMGVPDWHNFDTGNIHRPKDFSHTLGHMLSQPNSVLPQLLEWLNSSLSPLSQEKWEWCDEHVELLLCLVAKVLLLVPSNWGGQRILWSARSYVYVKCPQHCLLHQETLQVPKYKIICWKFFQCDNTQSSANILVYIFLKTDAFRKKMCVMECTE